MRNSLIVLAAIVSLALTSTDVLADAPGWRDNLDAYNNRSAYQEWGFGDSDPGDPIGLGVAPDAYVNPPHDSSPEENPLGAIIYGGDWIDQVDGRSGVWSISSGGAILFNIPNYPGDPEDYPEKKVWIHLLWRPETTPLPLGDTPDDVLNISGMDPSASPFILEWMDHSDPDSFGWFHTDASLMISPNPSFEMLIIAGDILVDEVIIDTICPEPGTLLLLGIGIPFVLKLKRRGRN